MAKRATSRCATLAPIANSAKHVVGRREVQVLEDLLADLHRAHTHPNRTLFFDHVVIAHLLVFFNPALRGLRSIQELFDDARVRKTFSTPRIPKSTLADAQRVFDPDLLLPLIAALQTRLGNLPKAAPLDHLTQQLIAVDGSFFAVAPRIAWALYNQHKGARSVRKGNVRLHTQFDVVRGLPTQVSLTDGQTSETHALRQHLAPGCVYIMDRGFQAYQLLADIHAAGSDFLVRLRKSAAATVVMTRPLTAPDQVAGVIADEEIELGWRRTQTAALPPVRRVVVRGPDRQGVVHDVVLLTSRYDLAAHEVALLYRHRWQVELFFRWLKCVAHFEHFFSESPTGMTLQVYVTMIGTLLIALQIGARPTKYDYALMSSALLGWTSLDHARAMALERRDKAARAAQRRAARAASKTSR
jgi:hypothetical protein